MSFDVFLNFDGDCREAVEFYAKVFGVEMPQQIMTYGDAPGFAGPEADRGRIIYSSLPIFGTNMMFSDCPSGTDFVKGTNFMLTLGVDDAEEIERLHTALSSEGGSVVMPLEKTFFAEMFSMVTDQFGVSWQLTLNSESV